jgi:hypothetical protein
MFKPAPGAWLARCALPLLTLLLLVPQPTQAQSAPEIFTRMMEAYESRLQGVEDLTIRQEVMGFSSTTYLVKETVDGRPTLQVRSSGLDGVEGMDLDTEAIWAHPWTTWEEGVDRWALEGTGTVDGRPTWQLSLTDFEGLDLDALVPDDEAAFDPHQLLIDVDQELLAPLRVQMSGQVTHEGRDHPVSMDMLFSDYREVDGYLHPFLVSMETDLAGAGISDAEMAEARRGLEELRAQLESMPEAQREMMERMMGEQIRALEEMVESGGIRVEIRALDLQVNSGPPSN